eukprot:TRINITY_DN16050_c0_g1_i1.p1 TRINITY_DN16050_c0_g1~~TRINITY_DN16050_c0_g1_i1.p1  ORF type:complete len:343 (+),score=55.92 TRINITY_DN16050_c0_g1_i1:58-1086(+)
MSSAGSASDEEAQELDEQRADWTRRILVVAFVASTLALIFYHLQTTKAGLSSALYLITQIVTTIGYGDIAPTRRLHRALIALYVLLALVVLAYFLNNFVKMLTDREEEFMMQVIEQAGHSDIVHEQLRDDRLWGKNTQFCKSTVLFLSYIAFGTIFYSTYEGCSCGYGSTIVEGCDPTSYETCSQGKNPGQIKDVVSAFYFSVITLTTVGFGDLTPMTVVGRYIGIFWMLTGVVITANWVGQLTTLFLERNDHAEKKKLLQKVQTLVDEVFAKLDYDNDDALTRAEHHLYMLQKYGLLSNATLASLDGHFDKLDEKKSGQVTLEQIRVFETQPTYALGAMYI